MNAVTSSTTLVVGHEVTLLPAAAYEASFTSICDSVGFAFDAQSGHHAIGSDKMEAFSRLPNSLALLPCGCDVRSGSERGGEYLLVSGPLIGTSQERYRTNIQNTEAIEAACWLRRSLLGNSQQTDLQAEKMIQQLSEAARRRCRPSKAARWMTSRRFKLITEMIEDNLDSRLTVAELARAISVSASFLNRAFKAYCGQTPYDFILSRRLQRARYLIATTKLPLPEIALQAGFSSQSHMTSIMNARLGLSPSMIRRQ